MRKGARVTPSQSKSRKSAGAKVQLNFQLPETVDNELRAFLKERFGENRRPLVSDICTASVILFLHASKSVQSASILAAHAERVLGDDSLRGSIRLAIDGQRATGPEAISSNAHLSSEHSPEDAGATWLERIDLLRRRKGWTWSELSRRSGASRSSIENWRHPGKGRATTDPSLRNALGLAHALEVPIDWLFAPQQSSKKTKPKKDRKDARRSK